MEFIAFCPRTRAHWFGLWFILYFSSLPSSPLILSSLSSRMHIMDTQRYSVTVTGGDCGADEWENAHVTVHTREPRAARLRGSSQKKNKGIGEREVELQREAVRAGVSYRMWHTPLSLSLFSLSESFTTPDDPLCSRNSLGKQGGPWLGRNGREGSPRGGEVCWCVMCEVCSWIRYTSFNPLRYRTRSHPHLSLTSQKDRRRQRTSAVPNVLRIQKHSSAG